MVGGTSPLSLGTLLLMGIVVHHNSRFILTLIIEQPLAGGEDDELDDESGSDSSLPSATEPAGLSDRAITYSQRKSHI